MSKSREEADESLPNWACQVVNSFASLAHLHPGSSVLCVGTSGIGQLVIRVRSVLNNKHGMIVGVEYARKKLDQAQNALETLGWEDEITLHLGDITTLHLINDLHNSDNLALPTFDVIFAWNALDRVPVNDRASTLRRCGTYLTPGTGRLVVTLALREIAGILAINNHGDAIHCKNLMLESEWALGEEALGTLVTAAGLSLGRTQRVGYDGESSLQWTDEGSIYHQHADGRYSEVWREPGFNPKWSNPDGTLSRFFKAQMKFEVRDAWWKALKNGNATGPEGIVDVEDFFAAVAGVVGPRE